MDVLWLLFISACAIVGILLTVWWVRSRQSEDYELAQLEEAARRVNRRRGTPRGPTRPPPPTPDLVTVRETWIQREDTDPSARPLALNIQSSLTPTAPAAPRPGFQGALPSLTARRNPIRTEDPVE